MNFNYLIIDLRIEKNLKSLGVTETTRFVSVSFDSLKKEWYCICIQSDIGSCNCPKILQNFCF